MRFLVIVKATKQSEAGVLPDEKMLAAMGKYNEELSRAGVLLDGAGLKPSSQGVRVRFHGDKRTILDGPFPETKELIAGYWIFQTKSLAECIEWVKRSPPPFQEECDIEVRPLFETADFEMSEETRATHARVASELEKAKPARA
jgi:hypothetical protein